jgi:hypothetical protein
VAAVVLPHQVLSRIESEDLMLPLDWTLRIGDQTKA